MKAETVLEVFYRTILLLCIIYLILIAQYLLEKQAEQNKKISYIYESFKQFDLNCIEE